MFLSKKAKDASQATFKRLMRKRLDKFPVFGENSQDKEQPDGTKRKKDTKPKEEPKLQEEQHTFKEFYDQFKSTHKELRATAGKHFNLMNMYSEQIELTALKERGSPRSRYTKEKKQVHKTISRMNSLANQIQSPYFGRIDFKFTTQKPLRKYFGKTRTFYIGKGGTELEDIKITDWRAPVSSVFYNFPQPTPDCFYKTDKHIINGELTLKRKIEIENTTLTEVFDGNELVSLVGSDPFLLRQLKKDASSKLKDIISSIQAEQNKIISIEPDKDIIVQGVAGSGKTSIAIHRLSWLLYNYKEITPQQCLIVAPNRLFLRYIADLLPEIGSEQVPQSTFTDWAILKLKHTVSHNQIDLTHDNSEHKTSINFMKKIDKLAKRMVTKHSTPISEKTILNGYLTYVKSDILTVSDLAPLLYLRFLLKGILEPEKLHYLVIDEAQDHTPAEIFILKRYAERGRTLLVGDLMQGIINPNGITSWTNLIKDIYNPKETLFFNIRTSYRSTMSIINFVNQRLQKEGVPSQYLPKPVLRKGVPTEIMSNLDIDEIIEKIIEVVGIEHSAKHSNIAIIVPEKFIPLFAKELKPHVKDITTIDNPDTLYNGGIVIGHVKLFKGLEFDTVIYVDHPEIEDYDQQLRHFYVACTRAMHKLYVFEK